MPKIRTFGSLLRSDLSHHFTLNNQSLHLPAIVITMLALERPGLVEEWLQ